ncbi:MAG: asparagine synthase-related protein [Planctomycetota bacterium]|nr:asparagine synthase-related protein [Planctomycetota bacterium]
MEGFRRLSADFSAAGAGTQGAFAASGVQIGLLLHHGGDAGSVRRAPDGSALVCAGDPGLPDSPEVLVRTRAALRAGEAAGLAGADPPWAACLVDHQRRDLYLVTDAFGLRPLYYARWGDLLVFGTRVAPLLRAGLGAWEIDRQAVVDFLTFGHVTGDRTFAKEVRLLAPGSILSFGPGGLELRRYAGDLPEETHSKLGLDELAERMYAELHRSVRSSVAGASRIAVTLSGGLDSRALLGFALDTGAEVRAHTFGVPGALDVEHARRVAKRARCPHELVEIDHRFLPGRLDHAVGVTDGMVGATHFHILSLLERLAGADVVLDGLGGDALTGRHLGWGMIASRSVERAVGRVFEKRATVFADRAALGRILDPGFLAESVRQPRGAVSRHFEGLGGRPIWWGCHQFDLRERQRRFVQFGPHLLRPFVKVATPFYSLGFTDLVRRAPVRLLIEQRAYLRMHSLRLGVLAKAPDAARNLPVAWPQSLRFAKRVFDVAARRARRFLPVVGSAAGSATDYPAWFRGPLSDFVDERLLDGAAALEGVVSRKGVEELLSDHRVRGGDRSEQIGCLLSLARWMTHVGGRA